MVPLRYVTPTSLSPAAALHVWTAIFVASLAPPIALLMPFAHEAAARAAESSIGLMLALFSVAAVELLVVIAMKQKTPFGAALSAFLAVPFAVAVCAVAGGILGGPFGFLFAAALGLMVATPVGLLFGALLAPLFHLAKRAQASHALRLRDRVHSMAALYACFGCCFAILLGQPVWFAIPAILSFGFAAERWWLTAARARWVARAYAGELSRYSVLSVLESELTRGQSFDVPCLTEGEALHVLVADDDTASAAAQLGAYRTHPVQRPLLRLP